MMCGLLLRPRPARQREDEQRTGLFSHVRNFYSWSLGWALRHRALVLLIFIATICLNVELYIFVPKGFFPQQDTGRMVGSLQADQSISFQMMSQKLRQMMRIVQQDPAVQNVVGYTGVGSGGGYAQINTGNVFASLKPLSQRNLSVDQVIARLRPKLAQVSGGRLYLAAVQDLRAGGRQSNAQYQYTLQSENVQDLYEWTPKLVDALEHNSVLTDVSSDQQQRGLETYVDIDRDTTARLGVSPLQIDNTLYDAFGQRQVSVIYSAINQYHVVMEIDPRYTQYPDSLRDVYVSISGRYAPRHFDHQCTGRDGHSGNNGRHRRHLTWRCHPRPAPHHRPQHQAQPLRQLGERDCSAQRGNQCARQHRSRFDVRRSGGFHHEGDHDSAGGCHPLPTEPHAVVGQSPGPVRRLNHVVQFATG